MIFGRNDDYCSLTKKLAKRTAKVAKLIRNKIESLGSIYYSKYDDGVMRYAVEPGEIEAVKIISNGDMKYLAVRCYLGVDYNNQPQYEWHSLEHMNGIGSVFGVLGASNKSAISFLLVSSELLVKLRKLDKLKKESHSKEKEKIKRALKYTKSLV